jgi:hypothetical protein
MKCKIGIIASGFVLFAGIAGIFGGSAIARAAVTAAGLTAFSPQSAHRNVFNGLYNFIPIILVTAALYVLTLVLAERNIIRKQIHRRIWNVVLLLSTFVSAVLGLLLILNLEFRMGINLPFNMLFWHVEASIVMGFILLLHIIRHWKYFATIFKADGEEK